MTKFALNLIVIITSSVALAVPLAWTVETSRAELKRFDAYHGETLTIKASLMDCGKPANLEDHTATLYYQTNGMDQAWWTIAGAITGNVAVATFKPADDPGAKQLRFFLAVTGAVANRSYRANGIIRFLDSPGANPGWITPPVVKLDYAQLETLHAPYYTKIEADALHQHYQPRAQSVDLVPGGLKSTMPIALPSGGRPTGFRVPSETTYSNGFIYYKLKNDILNQTYTIDLQRLLTAEADPTVPDWARQPNKPTYMASEVGALPDNQAQLEANENFRAAVATVSPPVELPEKWALANVTNALGQAVGAGDVGAVPTSRKINGQPLTQDITIQGMPDHISASVVTNADGSAINGAGRVWADDNRNMGMVDIGVEVLVPVFGDDYGLFSGNFTDDRLTDGASVVQYASGAFYRWDAWHGYGQPDHGAYLPDGWGTLALQSWQSLSSMLDDTDASELAAHPTFSNAVLAVGLDIDTDSVAVLNEIAATFGDFPIEGTATTLGGLLAALAAAVAWLKKRTAHLDAKVNEAFKATVVEESDDVVLVLETIEQ